MRGHAAAALGLALAASLSGCIVQGECFGDADCAGGRICVAGECVRECREDGECPGCRRCAEGRCTECCRDSDCAAEERCAEEVCVPAEGCLGCGALPQGAGACLHGICIVAACEAGWHDWDRDPATGCEAHCVPTAPPDEVCDFVDNDCDGRVDEDFNLALDPEHCGACDRPCPVPPNAAPVCAGGLCVFACEPGWYDNDEEPENGCEATVCVPSAGGVERCDLRDNDCDGEVDEGIPKDTAESCGPLCQPCAALHAQASCVSGACVMGPCEPGWHDWDRDPATGCEAYCAPTEPPDEVCDGVDNDCDGQVDEGLLCACPEEMELVESVFCMDRYEASRPDATADEMGADTSRAVSQPGVQPWRNVSLQEAADACAAAGKRLCTPAEWEQVCRGPGGGEYCYGDVYEPTTCNGIDAFWPSFHVAPTGSFPGCVSAYGVYDVNGNVWERVQGGAGRGGAYNCSDSAALHRCGYVADWGVDPIPNFGFRCCL